MNISFDWDETITLDPKFWESMIKFSLVNNKNVYIVTMRYEHESDEIKEFVNKINKDSLNKITLVCTGREAKARVTARLGIDIHVWIDDSPHWILHDSVAASYR